MTNARMNSLTLYSILVSCLVAICVTKERGQPNNFKRGSSIIISLPQGRIKGVRKVGENGVKYRLYRGIPYAEPPVGPLRFKFPVPAGGWEGIRDGTQKPNACPQFERSLKKHIGDEDCLYLDVYTPENASGLDVMVYIHGGYFSDGFNGYDGNGDYLVTKDVVVVMLQYRLGVLGFLSTGDDEIAGNFGLRDQNLALQWVKNNIDYFGGDQSKITLFGESAGAVSVHMQILSPYGKGLFSRAILQSGNALTHFATRNDHAAIAQRVGRDLGCPGVIKDNITREASLLVCLQAANATQLVTLYTKYQTLDVVPILFVPRVDGDFLPAAPEELLRQGLYNRIDIISGVNRDEGALFTKRLYADPLLRFGLVLGFIKTGPLVFMLDDEEWLIDQLDLPLVTATDSAYQDFLLLKWRKKVAEKIFTEYVGAVTFKDEDAEPLTKMFGDYHFFVPHDETVQLHAADGITKVYAYELHHRGPQSFYDDYNTTIGSHWVPHTEDLQFIFSNVPQFDPLVSKDDLKLRQIMLTLWTNFAKFGNPTPHPVHGVTWSPVSKKQQPPLDNLVQMQNPHMAGVTLSPVSKKQQPSLNHLVLTPNPHMAHDTRCKVREFMSSLQTKQNHNLYSSYGPKTPRCYVLFNRLTNMS